MKFFANAERTVPSKAEDRRPKAEGWLAPNGRAPGGFTLIEVLVAMTVLLMLVLGMTRMFQQATAISNQGMTSIARNSVAETAMETILQDVDGMIVNDRIACYIESDAEDYGSHGFGFDDVWFVSTSGDMDDDMPYEFIRYYVKRETATNSLGAEYVRFDLHKARLLMALGDKNGAYPLEPATKGGAIAWWDAIPSGAWSGDDQVLAENVVQFDIYCKGWGGDGWMTGKGSTTEFDSRRNHSAGDIGNVSNVPPASFDIVLQVTSPEAAMEGGMALVSKMTDGGNMEVKGRELMIRESATYIGRAVPMTGVTQLHHPENHYFKSGDEGE